MVGAACHILCYGMAMGGVDRVFGTSDPLFWGPLFLLLSFFLLPTQCQNYLRTFPPFPLEPALLPHRGSPAHQPLQGAPAFRYHRCIVVFFTSHVLFTLLQQSINCRLICIIVWVRLDRQLDGVLSSIVWVTI